MITNAQLKIAVPNLDSKINNLEVNSVSEYILFDDLLRPLIKYDSNGELAPDLAESWTIQDNFKKYIFKIKPDQRFSNGSLISIEDVIYSLKKLVRKNATVHGSPKKIKKIYSIEGNSFAIELNSSDPFFITELSSPEFRIINKNSKNYNITSGPYFIENSSKTVFSLKKNNFFPFETPVTFSSVEYHGYKLKDLLKNDEFKNYDLIWPDSSIDKETASRIIKNNFYKYNLNLGFSYWFSINPQQLNFQERKIVSSKLKNTFENFEFFSQNDLEKSEQLFIPFGPGRLSKEEIERIKLSNEMNIQPLKRLQILLPKNIQKDLLEKIKLSFVKDEITFYNDFKQYSSLIKERNFDLALVNNDLSSIDLRSSIQVTFNKSRPLIWTDNKNLDIQALIESIGTEVNSQKRYLLIRKLGEEVLREALVYPLYYDYGFVFVKKGIDMSSLNKAGSETFSWKIK